MIKLVLSSIDLVHFREFTTKVKETPSNKRKKLTASTRARISTRKVRKPVKTDNHGSFLQDQQSSANMGKQLNTSGQDPSSEEPKEQL